MASSPSNRSPRSNAKATVATASSISVSRSFTPPQSGSGVSVRNVSSASSPTSASALLLHAEELQQTPDNRLLSYLMDRYNAVRAISTQPNLWSTTPSPSPTVAAAAAPSSLLLVSPFTSAFVEELLTPRLLYSAIPDVSQLVACLLCDAVRLHHQLQQQQQQGEPRKFAGNDSFNGELNTSDSTAPPPSPSKVWESQNMIENDVAAGVAPLPFASVRCADVLHCIARVFAELLPASASPLPLKRVAYLIERAAVAHIFCYLLPHCSMASAEVQNALQCVFDAVRCATISTTTTAITNPSPSTTLGNAGVSVGGGLKSAGSGASVATCNEMAQLLIDILASTRDITSAQLTPLLEELAGAAAALRHTSKTSWTANIGHGTSSSSTIGSLMAGSKSDRNSDDASRPLQLRGGALIAAHVLLEQTDVALQPAVAAWAVGEFDEGVEELMAAGVLQEEGEVDSGTADEVNGGDNEDEVELKKIGDEERRQLLTRGSLPFQKNTERQLSRRREGLRKVARVLGVLVALTELNVDLVDQVLPVLAPHLEHPNTDLRLLLVRGFGAIFAAHDAAVSTYTTIFMGPFLNRFVDVKPTIRTEALKVSTTLLSQCTIHSNTYISRNVGGSCAPEELWNCASQQARLWTSFQPCWSRLLTDPQVLVRKQAVISITSAALAAPLLFQQHMSAAQVKKRQRGNDKSHDTPVSLQPSLFLAQTLGLRARDKNKRVRDAAVEALTKLYQAYRLPWIPNTVLDATRVEASSSAAANSTSTGRSGATTPAQAVTPAEVVVENLLPLPSTTAALSTAGGGVSSGATSGRQSMLTHWMGASPVGAAAASSSANAADQRTSGGRPNLVLFDCEEADNDDAPRTKPENMENEEGNDKERWAEGDALLGLKPAAAGSRGASLYAQPVEGTATLSFVDGLLHLCQSVDAVHFTQLLRLAEKKPQLRLAIQKLFEFHAAVKASNGDVKSAEGQQRINAIHRLLRFLQDTTGACKGEWDALFRAKDDTVRKALLRACHPSHLDWLDVRNVLLHTLQGRVGANEFAFVKNTLLPQLLLPTQLEHVQELLRRLHRSIYVSDRAEVVVDTPEVVAVLRALLLLTAGAPSYCRLTAAGLAEALQAAAKQSTAPPPVWCELLLLALQQWATAAAVAEAPAATTTNGEATEGSASLTAEQRQKLVHTLQSMATASLPMQQVAARVDMRKPSKKADALMPGPCLSSPLKSLKQLAKQATRTLLVLLEVPCFEKDVAAALQSLVAQLTHQLTSGRALTNDAKTVSWLASVQALSTHPRAIAALCAVEPTKATPATTAAVGSVAATKETPPMPALLPHLRTLLLAAVVDVSDVAEHAKLAKLQSNAAAADEDGNNEEVSVAPLTIPATLTSVTMSVAVAIVDGAAKAMSRLALSCPLANAARATAVAFAMESLLQAYKAVAGIPSGRAGPSSIGSCQRRLAVEKQLVKLLATPTADIAKEMAASVVLSIEEEVQVRELVQNKLASLLLQHSCDMRVAALLLLTAVSEDTRSSYQRLRNLVESVGDHLREKQTSQGVSLSSSTALYCYWEYTIPFIVLFLAHHPYYPSEEAETQFVSFQRVWHLLVGELFRHGTQCAGFVVELLSKLKQSDDALDPSSNATRVMCDLGSRVLLECLGQRQSRAEDLRRYPGAILLPSFFVKTSQGSPQKLLETVYLSDSVRVAPNPPFRLTSAVAAAGTGGRSHGTSRQATPRASSLATANDLFTSKAPVHKQQQQTPSTQRKRQRSPSAEAVVMDGSPLVSLASSVPPEELCSRGAAAPPSSSSSLSSSQRARTEPALADIAESVAPAHVYADNNANTAAETDEEEEGKMECDDDDTSVQREAAQRDAVNGTLQELFSGLTKTQIAQLRWKVVRARLEEALHEATANFDAQQLKRFGRVSRKQNSLRMVASESSLEGLLQYAKSQLRVWYNDAPA